VAEDLTSRTPAPNDPVTKIRFPFRLDKMVQALVYFDKKRVPGLTMLKAVKLLYLTDRYHLLLYARPIIGGQYSCLQHGPVPLDSYDVISNAVTGDEVASPAEDEFGRRIKVHRGFKYRYPVLKARGETDLNVFSESEVEALDWVIATHGGKTARELVDFTHAHAAWKCSEESQGLGRSSEIPYELFFADNPESANALEVARIEQEDRDATDALRREAVEALAE
jgi:uncharacterized phage-associated protein